MGANDSKTITISGRLSFPSFTAKEAHDLSQKGDYPTASPADAKPHFELLVEQTMHDKLAAFCEETFLPYCVQQAAKKEKRDSLTQDEVDKLLAGLADLENQTFNSPFKPIGKKTADLAPECVSSVKVIGNAGVDMKLMAIVNDESELLIPDPDQLKWPTLRPLDSTVHSMYPGAYVSVTLNLYAYHNGKHPGFSAGASTAVFRADGDRFGGGVAVDEDAIFMD